MHPSLPADHRPPTYNHREFFRSKGTYVLAPMIDSLNHKSTVPTDLDYDSLRSRFRLRLGQGYRAGEQVFMSYGAKGNDDLVMYYGFVEPDSAADAFEFGDLLAWLQEHRGGAVNDDRLQTMYSKGLQDAVRCVCFRVCLGGVQRGGDGETWLNGHVP